MAQTGTISQFFPPETLQSSESLLMSVLWAAMEEGVSAHLRSSLIAAASAAVEWILNVKLGSWEFSQFRQRRQGGVELEQHGAETGLDGPEARGLRGVKRGRAVEPEGVALGGVLAASPILFFLACIRILGCPVSRGIGVALGVAQYGNVDVTDGAAAGRHFVDAAKVVCDELVDPGVLRAKEGHAKFRTSGEHPLRVYPSMVQDLMRGRIQELHNEVGECGLRW